MKILLRCLIIMVSKALINIDLIQSVSVQGQTVCSVHEPIRRYNVSQAILIYHACSFGS